MPALTIQLANCPTIQLPQLYHSFFHCVNREFLYSFPAWYNQTKFDSHHLLLHERRNTQYAPRTTSLVTRPMSLFRLWAITRKEFRHIQRDKRTLFLVTLSPAVILFAFAYLFSLEVQQVRLGVWDLDQSALSRRFVASLVSDGKFAITTTLRDYTSLREAMMRGEIHLGVVIPPDFEAKLLAGERVPVQAIGDGSDAISAITAISRFQQRALLFNQRIAVSEAEIQMPISLRLQAWYNRELNSTLSMVPGLLPIALILPSLAIALALTRERELGSFETLITTPIRGLEYLLGKLIPYVTYGLVSALIAFTLTIVWFGVPLRGPIPDLLVLTLAYLFAALGETLFICSFLTSQGTAMRVVLLIFFIPSFFLSGVILPVDTRSGPGQAVSFFLPTTYFVQIMRSVFLKGMTVLELGTPALTLFLLGLVPFVLSLIVFRKQVD